MPPDPTVGAFRIFEQALQRNKAERTAFLERACAGDESLREEVEGLLAHDDMAEAGFMEVRANQTDFTKSAPTSTGELQKDAPSPGSGAPLDVPGYEIISELSRGGQGVVYRALQRATKRVVALKMLLSGRFASEWDRLRFRREIDLAASLSHPNIITIFDSGDVAGIPFFAMEFIEGQPLTKWASELPSGSTKTGASRTGSDLAATSRPSRSRKRRLQVLLELFVKVCDAVAYSHRHGVIHRDLKPSNILVDSQGEPHVLDFGLARLLKGGAAGEVELTRSGEFMGTLAYASPEQARGDRAQIDTRTDVYSLGVMLFQLLTDRFPYDVQSGTALERLERIRLSEPMRPSRLEPLSRGDLEVIVLKALAKEPDRRYASAAELAGDVRAWLRGDAISARRDHLGYVLRKLARRHWAAASIVGLLAIIVLSFASVSYVLYLDGQQAITRLRKSEQETTQLARLAEQKLDLAFAGDRFRTLMNFLLEWHADRIELARTIQQTVDSKLAEWKCMEFLLSSEADETALVRDLGERDPALAYFCLGERSLKRANRAAAREAFSRVLEAGTVLPELRSAVEARLAQLDRTP